MKNKKFRKIILIIWGMVFCLNLFICLIISEPNAFSWIMVGFPLGIIIIKLLDYSLSNIEEEYIHILEISNKNYKSIFDKLIEKSNKKKVKTKRKKNE